MSVSGRHQRAIRHDFDSGISAVSRFSVVLESDVVLPAGSFDQILIGADPADPIPLVRGFFTAWPSAAVRDEQPAIGGVLRRVSIPVKRVGQVSWFGPGLPFVVRKNDL